MRYLKKTLGLLLAVIMCLNMFTLSVADEPVPMEEPAAEVAAEVAAEGAVQEETVIEAEQAGDEEKVLLEAEQAAVEEAVKDVPEVETSPAENESLTEEKVEEESVALADVVEKENKNEEPAAEETVAEEPVLEETVAGTEQTNEEIAVEETAAVEPIEEQTIVEESVENEIAVEEVSPFIIEGETLKAYNGEDESVLIPEGIKVIGANAFAGNKTIKQVVLSDTVETIMTAAFEGCSNLEKVVIGSESRLATIQKDAFKATPKLDISFADGVANIDATAFELEEAESEKTESIEEPVTDNFVAEQKTTVEEAAVEEVVLEENVDEKIEVSDTIVGLAAVDEEEIEEIEVEEDEMLLTAAPADITLPLNTIQNLYLEGAYTQKAYINLENPGFLNLFIRFINTPVAATRATVRFTNSTMTTTYLYSTISFANNLAEISDWFDAGTYCVLISIVADNGDNYFPISYSIENVFQATNIEASNGNINVAANLSADGAYHDGLLSRTSNSRWWRISLTTPGFLEVDVRSFVLGEVHADVYLLRDGQMSRRIIRPLSVTLNPASPTNPEFKYASTWLESGEYYLNVFAKDQKTGEYSVMVSFKAANNNESNDDGTYLTANKLQLDGSSIRGLMSYTDEVDMFTFTVAETTNVDVSVMAFMSALNVKLYNSNMRTQLADMSASGTNGNMNRAHNHETRIRLDAGDYVLSVSRDPDPDPILKDYSNTGVYEARVRSTITIRRVNLTNGTIYTLGDTVSGNITYGGGTPLQYYFHLQMLDPATGNYVNISHITTDKNEFSFKPTAFGTYRVLAEVSDGVYTDAWASDSFTVKNATGLSVNSVDYNPSTLAAGETLTITAGVGGGAALSRVYYEIYDMSANLITRLSSAGDTVQWTPQAAGTYQTMVVAVDVAGNIAGMWGGSFTVTAAPTFAIASVDLSTTGTAKLNSPVTVNATTINGTAKVFVYELYYNGNYHSRTTSSSSTFTFRPNAAGTWAVMVVATDGKTYDSMWSSSFTVQSSPAISVSVIPDKTSVPANGSVTFSLKYSGNPNITYTQYQLWNTSPAMKVDEWTGNSNQHTFAIAAPGTYMVMAVVRDPSAAPNGIAAWSPAVSVATPPPITLTSFVPNMTSAFVNDVVTYNLTYSTGSPIQYHYYVYNASNVVVYSTVSTSSTFKYQYKYPGTYNVMAVATDGSDWKSIWNSTAVHVTSFGALQITGINVEGGNAKKYFEPFTVAPVFSNGKKVVQIFYEIYDATSSPATLLTASGGTTSASYTYKPQTWAYPSMTTFDVMIIATDGVDWTSAWLSAFAGPVTYTKPAQLKITSVTDNTWYAYSTSSGTYGAIELGDSVEFKGTVKDGAEVIESEFQVYYNPTSASFSGAAMIDIVNTRNNDSLLMIPNNRGFYRVYYVVFDGIDWVGKYSNWIYVDSDA